MSKKLTRQEIFDIVWKHFITDKNPFSVNQDTNSCRYRGPNDTKCAIGVLIPDNVYTDRIEGEVISSDVLLDIKPFASWLIKTFHAEDMRFLKALQEAHDAHSFNSGYDGLHRQLTIIATKYNLIIPS